MEEAQRIKQLPPYLFARIERKIDEFKAAGKDTILPPLYLLLKKAGSFTTTSASSLDTCWAVISERF